MCFTFVFSCIHITHAYVTAKLAIMQNQYTSNLNLRFLILGIHLFKRVKDERENFAVFSLILFIMFNRFLLLSTIQLYWLEISYLIIVIRLFKNYTPKSSKYNIQNKVSNLVIFYINLVFNKKMIKLNRSLSISSCRVTIITRLHNDAKCCTFIFIYPNIIHTTVGHRVAYILIDFEY